MRVSQPKRILHIAPLNISDVPMMLVRAERKIGHHSRLVTLFRDSRGYPEDLCLDLPGIDSNLVRRIKRLASDPAKLKVSNRLRTQPAQQPPIWQPHGKLENRLVRLREWWWQPEIENALDQLDFWNYDFYQLDGGLEFYRDGRLVHELARRGKKILLLYTGSDLRTRGLIPAVDAVAHARATVELDHLLLDERLTHVPFPFESHRYQHRITDPDNRPLRIGHAPTFRAAKGSERILEVLNKLATERDIEIVLIENRPHSEAIALKATCDIFIDQIGDLGYGINALEALALGVPCCTCLAEGFHLRFQNHPFLEITDTQLDTELLSLIDSPDRRRQMSIAGRLWLEQHHDSHAVVEQLHALLAH